jgi:hypothetical protein
MNWFWWIVVALLSFSLGAMVLSFTAFLFTDDSRWRARSRACRHWSWVIALAAFNIALLRHIILSVFE